MRAISDFCVACTSSSVVLEVMSWLELCLLVAYRGKMHGRKSVQDLVVARGKFSELTGAC